MRKIIVLSCIVIILCSTFVSAEMSTLRPNGNGQLNDWSTQTCDPNNMWQCVNDAWAGQDYVYVDQQNFEQTFQFDDLPVTQNPKIIHNVSITFLGKQIDQDHRVIQPIAHVGGETYVEDQITLREQFVYNVAMRRGFPKNPATGLLWTEDEVNNIEMGMKSNPTFDPGGRVHRVHLNVTWEEGGELGGYDSVIRPNGTGFWSQWDVTNCDDQKKWECVNENINDQSNFIHQWPVLDKHTFSFYNLPETINPKIIHNVTLWYVAKEWNVNEDQMQVLMMGENQNEFRGDIFQVNDEYVAYSQVFHLNPLTNNSWTANDVNDLDAGVLVPGGVGAGGAKVSQIYAGVMWDEIENSMVELRPDGNGDFDGWHTWTCDIENKWQCVDEAIPDENDDVFTADSGQDLTFSMEDLPPPGPERYVVDVTPTYYARWINGVNYRFKTLFDTNPGRHEGKAHNVTENYDYYTETVDHNPTTEMRWQEADVNNLDMGMTTSSWPFFFSGAHVAQTFLDVELGTVIHHSCKLLQCGQQYAKDECFEIDGDDHEYKDSDDVATSEPKVRFKNLDTAETIDRPVVFDQQGVGSFSYTHHGQTYHFVSAPNADTNQDDWDIVHVCE
jgi:hypothetical protein